MPIRYVSPDEWYPVYSMEEERENPGRYGDNVEFSEDEIVRIERAFAEFDWAQEIMRDQLPPEVRR